ncbi:spore germination protein [Serpentinicella sp. ANB-PHB4]|uniref:spore germination protein n=1 Tax=Serpentinicella sp. ANB-PHB4 TaxID=3074076 RepID=UPI00286406C5|nr:spore germination protein [Serpentinicella sp. ANB-PHB4]MDR5658641.1 spore germination protein [Serpentinicella sp. ANB-PHB4]
MSKKSIFEKKYTNNLNTIKEQLKNTFDINYREIDTKNGRICAIFIDNMVDNHFISENIIKPLMTVNPLPITIEQINTEVLSVNTVNMVPNIDEALLNILSGNVLLLFSFCEGICYCEARGIEQRAVEQPVSDVSIQGPKESFTEDLNVNLSLVRRRIKNPSLKVEEFRLGNFSKSDVALMYIEDHAPEELVSYIRSKIESMDEKEFIIGLNNIEETLRSRNTFVNTIGHTERPDTIASNLTEGRVCISVNGSPFFLIAPYFFIDHFTTADDYYNNKLIGSFDRILRWLAFAIALLLPGLYLALTTYHFKLVPTMLLFRVAVLRAGVPYNTIVEIFVMYFFFLILRESGIRLPSPIGQAISIFGALILGDAAIGAGLTSEITVLVVALSSICTFLVPSLFNALVAWTAIILVFTGFIGLPGYYIAFTLFVTHIAGLTSCGYPFLFPLGTLRSFKFRDIFYRQNLKDISNTILQGDDQ